MMKKSIKIALSLVASTMLFTGCGGGGDTSDDAPIDSPQSGVISKTKTPVVNPSKKPVYKTESIVGYVIDSPIWGLEYNCEGQKTSYTDKQGRFECQKLPVTFNIGNAKIGSISNITDDKKIFPQDIVGVNRDKVDDEDVVKLTRFFQSLDDDGDTKEAIKITSDVVEAFNDVDHFDVVASSEDKISSKINETMGKDLISKDVAQKHLRSNMVKDKEPIGIELSFSNNEIAKGLAGRVTVNGLYSIGEGSVKSIITDMSSIKFETSDASVAMIDKNGNIETFDEGMVTISAKYGKFIATKDLRVTHTELTKIKIKKPTFAESTKLATNGCIELKVDGYYSSNELVKDVTSQVQWSSKSPFFSDLDPHRNTICSDKKGETSIEAELFDLTDKVEFDIKEYNITRVGIKSNIDKITIPLGSRVKIGNRIYNGETISNTMPPKYIYDNNPTPYGYSDFISKYPILEKKYTYDNISLYGIYEDNSTLPIYTENLSVDDNETAYIKSIKNGYYRDINVQDAYHDDGTYIYANKLGKSKIEVDYKGGKYNIPVEVIEPIVDEIKVENFTFIGKSSDLNATYTNVIELNKSVSINVVGKYSDNSSKYLSQNLKFESLNSTIFSVDESGLVTALKDGHGSIKVTYNAKDKNITDILELETYNFVLDADSIFGLNGYIWTSLRKKDGRVSYAEAMNVCKSINMSLPSVEQIEATPKLNTYPKFHLDNIMSSNSSQGLIVWTKDYGRVYSFMKSGESGEYKLSTLESKNDTYFYTCTQKQLNDN